MPKFNPPGMPELPKPPDPALPLRLIRKFIGNTKEALERAKQGVRDVGEEIKKPFDRY